MTTPKRFRLPASGIIIVFFLTAAACNSCGNRSVRQSATFSDCENSLQSLIQRSGFKSAFKSNFRAKIESEEGNEIRVQLVVSSEGGKQEENTIGWLIINTATQTIKDITNDPENPEIVSFIPADWTKFITCHDNTNKIISAI